MNYRLHPFLIVLLAFGLIATVPAPAQAQDFIDGIAALVNNDVVTFNQVRELVAAKENAAHKEFQGQALVEKIKEIRLQAVNDLIDRQLILQEFKKMKEKGASIPDHVVDEKIDTIIREEFGGDRSAFIRTLAAQGYTLDRFREDQMNGIIVQAMRSQLVKPNTIVPEPKITEFYQQNKEQFTSEEQIHLRQLLIKKADDAAGQRSTVEEIRQKVVGGAAFEDLARLYSEDTTTKESGGDLGWVNRRYLTESLSKVAFSLKPGQVSKIIDLGDYYYLFYCEAHKPEVVRTLVQVREEIEKALLQAERQKAQQQWIASLRKKAFIKIL